MSEEWIIKYIKDEIENEIDTFHWFDNTPKNETRRQIEESIKAHQGLLDLYTHKKGRVEELKQELLEEKEKNKKIEDKIMEQDLMIIGLKENRRIAVEEIQEQYYVSKDKIKEIIDKIDTEDYYCLNEAEEDLRKLVE